MSSSSASHKPFASRDASPADTLYSKLYDLRRGKTGDHERPHKPALLLALIDLVDSGHFSNNRFALDTSRRWQLSPLVDSLIPEYIKDYVSLNQFVA